MPGRFLLDTNIVIALFADDPAVKVRLAVAIEVFIPCIVLGELYYSARRSARIVDNLARIDQFAASVTALPCDSTTLRFHQGQTPGKGTSPARK